MAIEDQEPDKEIEVPITEVAKDKSLTYMGIILGGIIVILGYLTLFVDDPWKVFRKEKQQITQATDSGALLNETSSMSDEEVRQSLIKFIQAFYYDQSRGYFDPPSYFAPITETFYNYHNLNYSRLKDLYWKRRADMENLKRNWIVSSLEFTRQDDRIVATYWATESFFRPSRKEQQSADIKFEIITDGNGKIVSLRELEIKNFESYPVNPFPDSIDTVLPNPAPNLPQQTPTQPQPLPPPQTNTAPAEDNRVYNLNAVESRPEFPGGEKQMINYLTTNSRYPLRARQNANNGKVELSFVVEKTGELKDVKLVKGIGGPQDDEALRLMRLSPKWKPGIIAGKPVRTSYQMHIVFKD
ncbi:MAG: energy transducer TonB [Sphingobacteriaceae bacterium]|jgi:TonB family protein|nr:energy transducer TonB [Sphingobacteriaceae bacterium]